MSEKLLDIKDLHVQYDTDDGSVYALNGINLELNKGETIGLVGETGAGKTTLALSILKLLPAKVGNITQGEIDYKGKKILQLKENELLALRGEKISMIFQDPMTSLNPVMTVGAQVHEVLDLHFSEMGKEQKDELVDNMFQLVGIPPARKGDYPHQFSGGMKQRIVIAMSLIAEPELLLADEPTTALDVTIQAQILELIRGLKEKFQTSMILVTHNLGIVTECCDKVAIIYGGEILESGTVTDVYSRKINHHYTEGLFNCIPDIATTVERLSPIPGYMVNPRELSIGCRFVARCGKSTAICHSQKPSPVFVSSEHYIRCHHCEVPPHNLSRSQA